MMEPDYYSDEDDINVITQRLKKLRVRRRRRKNSYYDQEYFPRDDEVKQYQNKSPDRSYWIIHPAQNNMNWLIELPADTKQYNKVVNPFLKPNIQIHAVYKISNNYMSRQFELKEQQKKSVADCKVYKMYHFTTDDKVDSIVSNNFNWRLSGLSRGHKYGYGVNFSPDPKWAEQFCKSKKMKIVFIVDVLITAVQTGRPDMVLPDLDFDTTKSPKTTVYTKFEDSEFLPKYVVYYYRIN